MSLILKTSQSSAQIIVKDKSNAKHSGNVSWINLILPGGASIWLFILPLNRLMWWNNIVPSSHKSHRVNCAQILKSLNIQNDSLFWCVSNSIFNWHWKWIFKLWKSIIFSLEYLSVMNVPRKGGKVVLPSPVVWTRRHSPQKQLNHWNKHFLLFDSVWKTKP